MKPSIFNYSKNKIDNDKKLIRFSNLKDLQGFSPRKCSNVFIDAFFSFSNKYSVMEVTDLNLVFVSFISLGISKKLNTYPYLHYHYLVSFAEGDYGISVFDEDLSFTERDSNFVISEYSKFVDSLVKQGLILEASESHLFQLEGRSLND